jgi:glycerophosphoryl diester phosphodiesterase
LRGKTRNFFENLSATFILGGLIYGGYSLYNHLNTNEVDKNQPTISYTKELPKKEEKEPLQTTQKNISNNASDELLLQETKTIVNKKVDIKTPKEIQEKNLAKKVEKNKTLTKEKISTIRKFLKETENKINNNIAKLNIKKDEEKTKSVKIRVTVLKNGDYEQITLSKGDKEFFNSIHPAIKNSFPITIDPIIDDQFPRYFRMEISN